MMIDGYYTSGTPPIALDQMAQSDESQKKRSWFNPRNPWFWISFLAVKPFTWGGTAWLIANKSLVVNWLSTTFKAATVAAVAIFGS